MKKWILLAIAVVMEVLGTLALRASIEHAAWVPFVVIAYVAAFALLGLALGAGFELGVAYGVWAAAGVALVALLGALIFGDVLSPIAIGGIVVIVVGVVCIETGSHAGSHADEQNAQRVAEVTL